MREGGGEEEGEGGRKRGGKEVIQTGFKNSLNADFCILVSVGLYVDI